MEKADKSWSLTEPKSIGSRPLPTESCTCRTQSRYHHSSHHMKRRHWVPVCQLLKQHATTGHDHALKVCHAPTLARPMRLQAAPSIIHRQEGSPAQFKLLSCCVHNCIEKEARVRPGKRGDFLGSTNHSYRKRRDQSHHGPDVGNEVE